MTSQFSDMKLLPRFFWRCRISVVKFSYWSKFYVNIFTGSGVIAIFIYKELISNSEIGNTPVSPISRDWGKLRMPNLMRISPMKSYWMLQNVRVAAFTVSGLLREWQPGGEVKVPPTQIRINIKKLWGIFS